jgi:hypothetical protein
LERTRNDIASDGSRIEGSHKGWNSIQRSFASGLEVFCAMAHDHVLRRNIRIVINRRDATPFEVSTFGSHHIHLVNHTAALWNALLKLEKNAPATLLPRAEMQIVDSGESFGLVHSKHTETFGGLVEIKDEDDNEIYEIPDLDADQVLREIGVDPVLRFLPLVTNGHEATALIGSNGALGRQDDGSALRGHLGSTSCGLSVGQTVSTYQAYVESFTDRKWRRGYLSVPYQQHPPQSTWCNKPTHL